MKQRLSEAEIDALKEVGNVGVGNAATALSRMIDKRVNIDIPETKFVPLALFADEVGGAERMVISLYLGIVGDLQGECLFIFPKEGALDLIKLVMSSEMAFKEMGDLEESAFKEVSNIFTGAYLNSLGKMLDMQILPTVPQVAIDMAQSVMDLLLIKVGRSADDILCVKTAIDIEGHNINGQYIMLFEEASLQKILQTLHQKFGI